MTFLRALALSCLIAGLMGYALLDAIVLRRLSPAAEAAMMGASMASLVVFRIILERQDEALGAEGGHGK